MSIGAEVAQAGVRWVTHADRFGDGSIRDERRLPVE